MAVRADDDQYSVLCNVHGEGLEEFGRVTPILPTSEWSLKVRRKKDENF